MSLVLRLFCVLVVLGIVQPIAVTSVRATNDWNSLCPSGFANFGDSFTDTGNLIDAFPFAADPENLPYGEKFFGKPAKRFSNGRLVPDFFSLAFRQPLLDPYFAVTSFNFRNGINFASAGANGAASPTAATPFSVTPFQIGQFIRFQNSVAASQKQPGCANFNVDLPSLLKPWSTWLYTIKAGGNDILPPLENGTPFSVVNDTIVPKAVNAIVTAIVTLYQRGARKFLIFGMGPGGCSTIILTYLTNATYTRDSLGCIADVNSICENFNSQLFSEIKLLRQNLTESNIAFFDSYNSYIEVLTNAAAYEGRCQAILGLIDGSAAFQLNFEILFEVWQQAVLAAAVAKTACCGAPGVGTLNYNPAIPCGHPSLGSSVCSNPDQHISWDGIHLTEAFYRVSARFMLNGQFTDGGSNYTQHCNLDFSKWGTDVTFEDAYPFEKCINLFT